MSSIAAVGGPSASGPWPRGAAVPDGRGARAAARQPVTARLLRPLLGTTVVVRTASATLCGTLLSCVKGSAWLVVGDTDVMLHLDDIVSVKAS